MSSSTPTTTPMRPSTARDLHRWLSANNLSHHSIISMSVLESAISASESYSPPPKKHCRSFLLTILSIHAITVTLLFRHHSQSVYPSLSHILGGYTVGVSFIILLLAVGFTATKKKVPRKFLCYGIPAAVTDNMIITVTLFGLQEGKGRAYQGEGRTLAVYALVVSCVLFFAVVFGSVGYWVRGKREEREGTIRLGEEEE
ncbi:hypothetical protein BDD12DRAFT_854300 [Trichophaea hybrida]|nr:hypothetical protein BDD12DRAFT_854300 [Trichophaea hybrida]